MSAASKYWQFIGFNAAGQRRVEVLDTAKYFFESFWDDLGRKHPQKFESDGFIQRQLWDYVQATCERPFLGDNVPESPAELCLRCCVSHLIEQSCSQLGQQFGKSHQFDYLELLPLVLDATSKAVSNPGSSYESLTSKILQKFDPSEGNLATWTIRLVRNDRQLNQFLLEHDVYLISDWAILNDSRLKQVEKILLEYHRQTPYEAQSASQLLRCYHAVYRGDRLEKGVKGRCLEPTPEQLQRIRAYFCQVTGQQSYAAEGGGNTVLDDLKSLASFLREYRITKRGGASKCESLDAVDPRTGALPQFVTSWPDDTQEQEQEEFLELYRNQLQDCLDEAINQVLDHRLESFKKKRQHQQISQSWLKGLYLFHCCDISMGEIAEKIGMKAQYQVSRLLKLKEMRTDIRHLTLMLLQERILDCAQKFLTPSQLQGLDMRLETILAEQVDDLFSQAASEVSAARFRVTRSLYADRLCQCLSRRVTS